MSTVVPNPATPMAGYHPFDNVAPEIFLSIMRLLGPEDRLGVDMVSRDFYQWASKPKADPTAPRDSVIPRRPISCNDFGAAHTRAEASLHHPTKYLTCTVCSTFKGPADFCDAQFRMYKPKRFCVPCGIARGTYTAGVLIIQGRRLFGCKRCRRALPFSDQYEGDVWALCRDTYKYPDQCLLCKPCFARRITEVVGCTWGDLIDAGDMARRMVAGSAV